MAAEPVTVEVWDYLARDRANENSTQIVRLEQRLSAAEENIADYEEWIPQAARILVWLIEQHPYSEE